MKMSLIFALFLIHAAIAVNLDTLAANQWKEILTKDQSFNLTNWTYENDVHADPVNGVLWVGPGHRGSPQDNIMYAYEPLSESLFTAHSALPPAKSCLRHFVFTPQDTAILLLGGVAGHQNSTGVFDSSYKKIVDKLWVPYGIYYYSINEKRWLHIRTPGNSYGVGAYRPRIKYDPVHDVVVYNLSGKTAVYNFHRNYWHTISATGGPGTRIDHAVAVDERRGLFYLMGGTSKSYCTDAVNDMWVLNIETETWTRLADFSVNPWEITPACIDYNTSMVYNERSDVILFVARDGAAYLFDCEAKDWSRMTSASAPLKCSGHLGYEARNNLFYLLGGSNAPQGINDQRTTQGLWICKHENTKSAEWESRIAAPDVSIEITSTSNTLRWHTVQGARFNVYRANAHPFPRGFVKLNSAPVDAGTYADNDIGAGTAYSYRVVAIDHLGREGHYSRHIYSSPARPLFVAASVESPSLVKVSWEENRDPSVIGYHVYRGKGSAIYSNTFTYSRITASPVTLTEFLDTVDLTDSIARGYVVTAVNVQGIESGLSPLTTTFPEPPLNFRSFKKQGETIYSTWNNHSLVGPSPIDSTILLWRSPSRTKIQGVNIYRGGTYNVVNPVPYNNMPLTDTLLTLYTRAQYGAGTFSARAVNILGQEGFITDQISPDNNQYTNGTQPFAPFAGRGLPPYGYPLTTEVFTGKQEGSGLLIYPNPCNSSIAILSSSTSKPVRIFDARGRLVAEFNALQLKNGRALLNVDKLPVGIYTISAEIMGTRQTKRVVVMR